MECDLPSLKRLDLNFSSPLYAIRRYDSSLTEQDLEDKEATEHLADVFISIFKLKHLRELHFESRCCFHPSPPAYSEFIINKLESCNVDLILPNLIVYHVSNDEEKLVNFMMSKAPNLKEVHVNALKRCKVPFVLPAYPVSVTSLNFELPYDEIELSCEVLKNLLVACPLLETLTIRGVLGKHINSLYGGVFPNMKKLEFYIYRYHKNFYLLDNWNTAFPNLEFLGYTGHEAFHEADGVERYEWKSVKRLRLRNCTTANSSILNIARAFPNLSECELGITEYGPDVSISPTDWKGLFPKLKQMKMVLTRPTFNQVIDLLRCRGDECTALIDLRLSGGGESRVYPAEQPISLLKVALYYVECIRISGMVGFYVRDLTPDLLLSSLERVPKKCKRLYFYYDKKVTYTGDLANVKQVDGQVWITFHSNK